jgi:hypothetical protein
MGAVHPTSHSGAREFDENRMRHGHPGHPDDPTASAAIRLDRRRTCPDQREAASFIPYACSLAMGARGIFSRLFLSTIPVIETIGA